MGLCIDKGPCSQRVKIGNYIVFVRYHSTDLHISSRQDFVGVGREDRDVIMI